MEENHVRYNQLKGYLEAALGTPDIDSHWLPSHIKTLMEHEILRPSFQLVLQVSPIKKDGSGIVGYHYSVKMNDDPENKVRSISPHDPKSICLKVAPPHTPYDSPLSYLTGDNGGRQLLGSLTTIGLTGEYLGAEVSDKVGVDTRGLTLGEVMSNMGNLDKLLYLRKLEGMFLNNPPSFEAGVNEIEECIAEAACGLHRSLFKSQ